MPVSTILLKTKGLFDSLKPSEKKAAKYLIERADDVIHFSINDFAENAGCSDATVSRFVRKLGFHRFSDFRISLVRELSSMENKKMVSRSVTGVEDVIHNIIKSGHNALDDMQKLVETRVFETVSDWIMDSRRVMFFGVGASGVMADMGASMLARLGLSSVSYSDPHMQAIVGANCTGQDTVIAISVSGTIKDTVKSVQIARDVGAKTVGITGGKDSPLAQNVDQVIYTYPQGFEAGVASFGARASQMCVLDILVSLIVWKNEHLVRNLEKVEHSIEKKRF